MDQTAAEAEFNRRKGGFSLTVQKGLEARQAISRSIREEYNSMGTTGISTHGEGDGRTGAPLGDKLDPASRSGPQLLNPFALLNKARTTRNAAGVQTKIPLWLADIQAAFVSLAVDPQPSGIDRHWANEQLTIAQKAAEHLRSRFG